MLARFKQKKQCVIIPVIVHLTGQDTTDKTSIQKLFIIVCGNKFDFKTTNPKFNNDMPRGGYNDIRVM